MDKYTLGDSPAAVTLAKLLNDKKTPRKRITSKLSRFNEDLTKIAKIKDITLSKKCAWFLRCDLIDYLDHLNTTKEIKSYAKNVVCRQYRKYIQAYETVFAMLKRIEQ